MIDNSFYDEPDETHDEPIERNRTAENNAIKWLAKRDVKAAAALDRHLNGTETIVLTSESDILGRPSPKWWVDGLIQQNTICVLAGSGGVGKTFMMLDLSRRIAAGVPSVDGRETIKGRVLYVAAEGVAAFGDRARAWNDYYGFALPDRGVIYAESGVNLSNMPSVMNLASVIEENEIDFVVLDTWAQLSFITDENSAAQTSRAMNNVKILRDARPGCTVVVVHHTNAAATKARGSTALRDNADTVIIASQVADGFTLSTRTEDGGKMKDAPEEKVRGFKLTTHGPSAVVTHAGAALNHPLWPAISTALADGAVHSSTEIRSACGISVASGPDYDKFKAFIAKLTKDGLLIKSGPSNRPAYQLAIEA